MAETTIMSTAQVYSITQYDLQPWICRDDNGDYWTVIRNLSDYLEVYKSTDGGTSWVLKKTIDNASFTTTPFPTQKFKIMNLSGSDKVYVFISSITTYTRAFGWIFNVTLDTNEIDLNYWEIQSDTYCKSYGQVAWDKFHQKLFYFYRQWTGTQMKTNTREIQLNGQMHATGTAAGGDPGENHMDYYFNPVDGYGYELSIEGNTFLRKKWLGTEIESVDWSHSSSVPYWQQVVCDSNGHPTVIWFKSDGGGSINSFNILTRNKDNLSSIVLNAQSSPSVNWIPTCMSSTIDAENNIHIFYTNPNDGEAYHLEYNGSWQAAVKISSDNDGKTVSCEKRPLLTDTNILITYQATV